MDGFCGPQGWALTLQNAKGETDLGPCFEDFFVVGLVPVLCAIFAAAKCLFSNRQGEKSAKERGHTSETDERTPLLGEIGVKEDDDMYGRPRQAGRRLLSTIHAYLLVLTCVCAFGVGILQTVHAVQHAKLYVSLVAAAAAVGGWFLMLVVSASDALLWRPPSWISTLFYFMSLLSILAKVRTATEFQSQDYTPTDTQVLLAQLFVYAIAMVLGVVWPDQPHMYNSDGEEFCPEFRVCPFSHLTYQYVVPLLIKGYKTPLKFKDVWLLAASDRTQHVSDHLFSTYMTDFNAATKNPKLFWWLLSMEIQPFTLSGIATALASIFSMVSPYILKELVGYMEGSNPLSTTMVAIYASGLFFGPFLSTLFYQYSFYAMIRMGMHWRSAMVAVIYKKAMRLSSTAKQQSTVGQITNLMSTDAEKVRDFAYDLHDVWWCPLMITMAMFLLFDIIGVSALAGVVVMVLTLPINGAVAMLFGKLQFKFMEQSDSRVSAMSELLKGMRVIKFFAWEDSFVAKVLGIRALELGQLLHYVYVRALADFMWKTTPVFVALATFFCYSQILGNKLNAVTVFGTLAAFNVLRAPLTMMPQVATSFVQAFTSFKRLNAFLSLPEVEERQDMSSSLKNGVSVGLSDVSVSWEAGKEPILDNLNLEITEGSLCCVVGGTGAGKTAFVMTLLGELHQNRGTVALRGRVAYASQQAWIMAGTIRENICFGQPYDATWYESVITACCLVKDFQLFDAGDATEIGEKGINLSGGQKQRISLARAVYSNPDIIIMDDPLSAVDAHVGKHIFKHCISGLLAGKTRILITHQLGLTLSTADKVVHIGKNGVSEQGTLKELMKLKGDVYESMQHLGDGEGVEEAEGEGKEELRFTEEDVRDAIHRGERIATTLIAEEGKAEGRVAYDIYKIYFAATGGSWFFVLCCVLYSVAQGTQMLNDYWTAWWSADKFHWEQSRYLLFYGIISITYGVMVLVRSFIVSKGGLKASQVLHVRLLNRIVRAPMRFFDTTPVGRILNRFSRDTESIDMTIMPLMGELYNTIFMTISSIIVISISTPMFLLSLPFLAVAYYYIAALYQASAREMKRYGSNTRSPVYQHFSESIDGTVTIRAYKAIDRFTSGMYAKLDTNNRAIVSSTLTNRWLAISLNSVGSFAVFFSGVLLLAAKGDISAGLAGMSLTYALSLTNVINGLVRIQADVEMGMNSVERVNEYCNVPQEASPIISDHRPSPSWPQKGEINIQNLVFKYSPELPPVLHNVSFHIKPQEKIGVVGRTGAGKSSLMLALFRLTEPAGGRIEIDGLDTSTIGLTDLRRSLGIIPQEPVLFTGTVRSNLDPFNNYSEEELWNALKCTNMEGVVKELPLLLDAPLTENGENFSVGQRQLLCLARAVLHRARVLVLDEATASVDFATDAFIQKTIRTEFKHATVLAVAHRLKTVIDYDRIAVLDKGRVIEFDDPYTLISDTTTVFHSMCKDSGEFDSLLRCAKTKDADEVVKLISRGSMDGSVPGGSMHTAAQIVSEITGGGSRGVTWRRTASDSSQGGMPVPGAGGAQSEFSTLVGSLPKMVHTPGQLGTTPMSDVIMLGSSNQTNM